MQSTTQASSPTLLPAQASHLPGFHPRPNPGLALHQRATRERRLAGATEALEPLHRRLAGARARRRFDIEFSIDRDAVAYDQMSDGCIGCSPTTAT